MYHGTVSRRHGLETAVRAVGLARDAIPGLTLFIAGQGDDLVRIGHLVEDLGLDSAVTLRKGFVPLQELLPTLRRAGVAVIPLIPDSFTKYMLPVKLLEYAALGVPVIATRTPTIEAYFGDSAVSFVAPEDPSALAQRIIQLYGAPEERRDFAAEAAAAMARHSWEEERTKYVALIDRLLDER